MARDRKTRPSYELWGMARERVERDYPAFLKSGLVQDAVQEGEMIRASLSDFGFALEPQSGWDRVGYEVRLVELSMTGLLPESKGNAQLMRECRQLARGIDKIAYSISELTRWQAVSVASILTSSSIAEHISDLFSTARSLETVAAYLDADKQRTKWATSRRREARLVLACKIAPLFEREFAMPAKPRGGSDVRDIRDENEWTKFFQVIAKLVIGEAETPDRQDILWETAKPSEMPISNIRQ